MPHKVVDFFRNHSTFDISAADLKNGARRYSSTRPSTDRVPSSSGSSLLSIEDRTAKMVQDPHKRLSLNMGGLHVSPKNSSKNLSTSAASLKVKIESPPLVFHGSATASTGALLSGQLTLHIVEDMAIESFKMKLACEVTKKKPFHNHCPECSSQSTDLTQWNFPTNLTKGKSSKRATSHILLHMSHTKQAQARIPSHSVSSSQAISQPP